MISDEARAVRWVPLVAALATAGAHGAVALAWPAGGTTAPLAADAAPGWSVLAALATAVPVGAPATRIALVSVVAAAVAAWLLVRLVIASGRHPIADAIGGVAGAALLACAGAWLGPATAPGAATLTGALVLGAVTALDRVATGGGVGAGVAAAATLGWLAALAPTTRVLLVPLIVLTVVRVRHGARWPLLVPAVVALAWAMAAAHAPLRGAAGAVATAPTPLATPTDLGGYGGAIVDQLGPIGAVAAALGAIVLFGRGRRSRWLALTVAAVVVAALLADAPLGARVGPLGVVAAALAAAFAIARLVQPIAPASGRVLVGLACAALLAIPAALGAAISLAAR